MWNSFEPLAKPEMPETPAHPLVGVVRRVLSEPSNKLLKDFLVSAANAPSFAPGRAFEDVTYREGYRGLALRILNLFETPDAK